ncbi:MAG TPA: GNAT family N-acetyltransferase [Patescibacteria group bacterium]|nr:GNAT family N-acetyltransferase [Patescibacteria group bacterium]
MEREKQLENPEFIFSVRMAGLSDINYIPEISEWTKNAGTMLPKTTEELLELFMRNRSAIVTNALGEIVSHAAATFIYDEDGAIEFGALVTGEKFKGRGAATLATKFLLRVLKNEYPGQTIFALANNMSEGIFKKLGAPIMSTGEVGDGVWVYCETSCPRFPGKGKCCDTPYKLTDIIT